MGSAFRAVLSHLWEALRDAVMPFSCHLCGTAAEQGKVVCPACMARIEALLHPPRRVVDVAVELPVFTVGVYEDPLGLAIRTMKYRPSARTWDCLAPAVARRVAEGNSPFPADVVIPVPLHPDRRASRGFNQAELIAGTMAKSLGIPASAALIRTRATRPQAECGADERQNNLLGAFDLAPGLAPEAFHGKRLLIVDDVATTGATLAACARALTPLRPTAVTALTLAHAYLRKAAFFQP